MKFLRLNSVRSRFPILDMGRVWQASAESAEAGVVLGAVLGVMLAATLLSLLALTSMLAVVGSNHAEFDLGDIAAWLMWLFMALTIAIVVIFASLVGSSIAAACFTAVSSFFVFATLALWIPAEHWDTVTRSHHRGMLYGAVLGVAQFPAAGLVLALNGYFRGDVGSLNPEAWMLIPVILVPVAVLLGGLTGASLALFNARCGRPPGPWYQLPYPFNEW